MTTPEKPKLVVTSMQRNSLRLPRMWLSSAAQLHR